MEDISAKDVAETHDGVWGLTMNEEASNSNFVFGCQAEFSEEKTN